MVRLGSLWLALVLGMTGLTACGDSRGADSGTARDTGAPPTDAPATDAPANGAASCSFTLVSGATRIDWVGTVRARMNGSANLMLVCQAVEGDTETNIDIGNATFDGPRVYRMDDFLSDGAIRYDGGADGGSYHSDSDGGSCVLDLTEAGPLDLRGDSVVPGGRVAGTFTCTALVDTSRNADPPSYAVENGVFAATVEM